MLGWGKWPKVGADGKAPKADTAPKTGERLIIGQDGTVLGRAGSDREQKEMIEEQRAA